MELSVFTQMLKDKHLTDLKRMKYKYPQQISEFVENLKMHYFEKLPLCDFKGECVVYSPMLVKTDIRTVKMLLKSSGDKYGVKALGEEIEASSAIENIDFSRDSIRNIMKGLSPEDESETRVLGYKKGLEFISDKENVISAENIYRLYMMTVGDFLHEQDALIEGNFYRHDSVYIMGNKLERSGLESKKLNSYMDRLIEFINTDDGMDDLTKAAIVHFYFAYLHPYFDGNGRMARLIHMWLLVQKGYESTMFVPFSKYIIKTKKDYYKAFSLVESNAEISGVIDVTAFVKYFCDNVYNRIVNGFSENTLENYNQILLQGTITPKEEALWNFVLSHYADGEFSTKQLEKDFSDVAYATVRAFVMKFEKLGLLKSRKFSNRVRYQIK